MSRTYREIRDYLQDAAPEWRTQRDIVQATRKAPGRVNPNILVQLRRMVKEGRVEVEPHPDNPDALRYRWTEEPRATHEMIEGLMASYAGQWVARTDIAAKLGMGAHNLHLQEVLGWLARYDDNWHRRTSEDGTDEYRYHPTAQQA